MRPYQKVLKWNNKKKQQQKKHPSQIPQQEEGNCGSTDVTETRDVSPYLTERRKSCPKCLADKKNGLRPFATFTARWAMACRNSPDDLNAGKATAQSEQWNCCIINCCRHTLVFCLTDDYCPSLFPTQSLCSIIACLGGTSTGLCYSGGTSCLLNAGRKKTSMFFSSFLFFCTTLIEKYPKVNQQVNRLWREVTDSVCCVILSNKGWGY